MRTFLLSSVFGVTVCITLLIFCCPAYAANPGEQAPTFSLPNTKNKVVNLRDFSGQVVLVDFWASWCDSCRKSLSWLDSLQGKYGPNGLQVIAVNLDTQSEKADEAIAGNPLRFLVLFDPTGKTPEAYNLSEMPTSYLIDPNGTIDSVHLGSSESNHSIMEQDIVRLIESNGRHK